MVKTFVCGIDAGIDVVGGKWKVLILWELKDQPKRFGELKRALAGVSEKMLIQHLRELERDEIVHREVFPEVPPRVHYSLTEHGVSLNEALGPLGAWGQRHKQRLEAIRRRPGPGWPTAAAHLPPGSPVGPAEGWWPPTCGR